MSLWRRVFDERRRTVVPLLILLVVNLGVLLLAVVPLQRGVANREAASVEALATLADARRLDFQARAARESTDTAESGLRAFYEDVLPADFNDAVQVTNFWLSSLARQNTVQLERGQYGVERDDDSGLTRMVAQAVLTGPYPGVRRFLHALETASEFVIVDRIELAQPNVEFNAGQLELLLDVSTYYVSPEAGVARGGAR